MLDKSYYIIIDVNSFLYIVANDTLLQNTQTAKYVEAINNKEIADFFSQSVCKVKYNHLQRTELIEFIDTAEKLNILTKVDELIFNNLPLNSKPFRSFNIIRDTSVLNNVTTESHFAYLNKQIFNVTIFLNNNCKKACIYCDKAYKNIISCTKDTTDNELNLNEFKRFMFLEDKLLSYNFTITGGNIFLYSQMTELIAFFDNLCGSVTYIVNYLNFEENFNYNIFNSKKTYFEIIVFSPIEHNQFELTISIIKKYNLNCSFVFAVTNENELDIFETIIDNYQLEDYSIKPIYNDNLPFFEKFTFMNAKEICSTLIPIHLLYRKRFRNINSYFKLIILNNGNIHSNINISSMGNIREDSYTDILQKEIDNKGSWYNVRTNLAPCKNCLYALLCPSPDNYEFVIGRNNLCNAKTI